MTARAHPNYAIVSGVGILKGKKYTRTERILSVDGDPNADPDSVKQRKDVYVINALNSYSVAMRMKSYFCNSRTVSLDFVIQDNEKPGDPVRFTDPHGMPSVGYLESTVNRASSFVRAKSQIVVGYAPEYWGNTYNYARLLDKNGVWTVPETMDGQTARIILIGGGTGGASGQHGTDKQDTDKTANQRLRRRDRRRRRQSFCYGNNGSRRGTVRVSNRRGRRRRSCDGGF